MEQPEKIAFKNQLKRWALDLLGQRMSTTKEAMRQAQEAANGEEKSSAGDKYETGRAMGHLQKDMHARQLAELVRELAALHAVNTEQLYREGRSGALLKTDQIAFFISIGLGKQLVEGVTIVFLSPQAPLARSLQDKRAGDSVVFNKETMIIRDIF
jgi:hypothetical protein